MQADDPSITRDQASEALKHAAARLEERKDEVVRVGAEFAAGFVEAYQRATTTGRST